MESTTLNIEDTSVTNIKSLSAWPLYADERRQTIIIKPKISNELEMDIF